MTVQEWLDKLTTAQAEFGAEAEVRLTVPAYVTVLLRSLEVPDPAVPIAITITPPPTPCAPTLPPGHANA